MNFLLPFFYMPFFMCLFLSAQDPTDPSPKWYTTLQVDPSNAPAIDGKLNDVVWATVPWASDFVEVSPDENTPPSVQTKFKIIYSEKYLFIALNLSIAPQISKRKSKTQYVSNALYKKGTRYILGTIDNQTLSAAVRINYSINPNLSIQYYGQPFISRGRYSDFKYVTNPTAEKLSDRFQSYDLSQIKLINNRYEIDDSKDGVSDYSFNDPDFSIVRFNSNLVVRWEYIPGSELFLVWSQGISTTISPEDSLGEGLETGIFGQQPQNIFLLKATYRFSL